MRINRRCVDPTDSINYGNDDLGRLLRMDRVGHDKGTFLWLFCFVKLIKVNINKLKEKITIAKKMIAKRSHAGFTLIESLLSLSLFLFILISSLGFFTSIRNHFFDLKREQEVNQAGYATLDKIRLDLFESGRGLVTPRSTGLIEAIQTSNDTLIIQSKDKIIPLDKDLVAGQTFIPLASTAGIIKGQKLLITAIEGSEMRTISSVSRQGIALDSSLDLSYPKDKTRVVLIKTVSIYLDSGSRILRRKVNTSPAQPLLEEVHSFDFDYELTSNLVSLRLTLTTKEEREYEVLIFPKNMALVSTP